MSLTHKTCKACGHIIRGRSDKKFCNDYCRNAFNNLLKAPTGNQIRNINNQLSKNRRVLDSLLPPGEQLVMVPMIELVGMGFNKKFHTQTKTTKTGTTYFYCYDLGYLIVEEENCIIMKTSATQ